MLRDTSGDSTFPIPPATSSTVWRTSEAAAPDDTRTSLDPVENRACTARGPSSTRKEISNTEVVINFRVLLILVTIKATWRRSFQN